MHLSRLSLLRILAGILAICCVSWSLGLVQFATTIPKEIANDSVRTDAIVVLTGGSERIATGVYLLANGLADKLLISGVGAPVSPLDLIGEELKSPHAIAAKITLGDMAEDTPGNALETRQWVANEKISSIRVVTAAYHMPRSLRELEYAMPEIIIIPHPVFPIQVKEKWWRHPGTASLIAGEYTKFLFSGARIRVFRLLSYTSMPNVSR
ncbi:MAG: YdcF family protein [Rhodospirillaceae bacterium]